MKKVVVLIMVFLVVLNLTAQTKKYKQYTVKKGETVRSIARDFDVNARDIYDLNPDIDRKPVENSIILVPILEETTIQNNVTYTVLPKETLYSLSKRFNISIDELIKLNPFLVDGLKEGQVLSIPKTNFENQAVEIVTETKSKEIIHKVEKGETIYSLIRRYQISEEKLTELNPTLKNGLKEGMELVIQTSKNTEEFKKEMANNNFKAAVKTPLNLGFSKGKSVNVALMLPFKLNEIEDVGAHFNNSSSLLNITTEFYQGALIAIDSLRAQGAIINLKTLDTESSDELLVSLLKTQNLTKTDLFIGPLFLSSAQKLAKNIANGFVLAPMNSKEHSKFNESNLVKAGVSLEILENKMIQFIKSKYNGQNIVVIGDNKPGSSGEADRIAWKLKSSGSINFVRILKPTAGYITKQQFEAVLNPSKPNWILIVGDDNVVITDAVNTFGIADKSIQIRLFRLNNEGNIERANNNHLARLEYTYPTSEYSNFEDPSVQAFVNDYKEKYLAPPSIYAIRGFDVTYDSLFRLLNDGVSVVSFDKYKFDRVAARFDYKPTTTAGLENSGVFIVKIEPDLSLSLLE